MLTTLRTYRLPAALVALTMVFGVLVPLVQHACAWANMSGMATSMELPCHDVAEAVPVSHDTGMPCHDTGTDGVHIAPGTPVGPGCCLITTEQPVVEVARISAPVLEHVVVLAPAYILTLPDTEPRASLRMRDASLESAPLPSPLHILHASLLI